MFATFNTDQDEIAVGDDPAFSLYDGLASFLIAGAVLFVLLKFSDYSYEPHTADFFRALTNPDTGNASLGIPATINDPALTNRMLPSLERAAPGKVRESDLITAAEDFTFFQRQVPGMLFFLGITPPGQVGKAPANHSPLFFVDESALVTGVRALAHLAADYLSSSSY